MQVIVNDRIANYQKLGNGNKVLVFLHGWGDSGNTFKDLIRSLQNDYKIINIDLPGFGGSQAPDSAWGLREYADFVSDLLKKINIKQVSGFIGHSYGGAVLIQGIGEKHLGSDKLILLGAAGIRGRNKMRKKALRALSKTAKIPLQLLPRDKRMAIKARAYKQLGSDFMLVPHMQETFKKIINEDVQATAKKINTPTLLIYGSEDQETPVDYAKTMNELIKGSELKIINGADHFVHQSHSGEIAQDIKEFMAK